MTGFPAEADEAADTAPAAQLAGYPGMPPPYGHALPPHMPYGMVPYGAGPGGMLYGGPPPPHMLGHPPPGFPPPYGMPPQQQHWPPPGMGAAPPPWMMPPGSMPAAAPPVPRAIPAPAPPPGPPPPSAMATVGRADGDAMVAGDAPAAAAAAAAVHLVYSDEAVSMEERRASLPRYSPLPGPRSRALGTDAMHAIDSRISSLLGAGPGPDGEAPGA